MKNKPVLFKWLAFAIPYAISLLLLKIIGPLMRSYRQVFGSIDFMGISIDWVLIFGLILILVFWSASYRLTTNWVGKKFGP